MFSIDQFTEQAQDANARARDILVRFGHDQVDTAHLLLALIEQPEGLVSGIIEKLGVDPHIVAGKLDDVLRASPRVNTYDNGVPERVLITPHIMHMLGVAEEEANQLKDEHIGTEHLLLAISTERDTPTARILADVGITRDKIMDAVKEIRGSQHVADS